MFLVHFFILFEMKNKQYEIKILVVTRLQVPPTTYELILNLTYYLSTNLLTTNLGSTY
jgi:hypothetical protein